jgi:23S rRNA pseudouridine1911/1915/1917 synthase
MNEVLTSGVDRASAIQVVAQAVVPVDAAGERLDKVLAELFPQYSRSRLSAWIKAGEVRVDGRSARPRDAVRGGERIELEARVEAATTSAPQAIALRCCTRMRTCS